MWLALVLAVAPASAADWSSGTATANLVWWPQSLYHVGWVGDIDGDGTDDVVGSGGTSQYSALFVYLGPATWYTWSSIGPSQDLRFPGLDPVEHVAPAGDVNGDGFADVVFSTFDAVSPGEVALLLGGPTGLAATPFQTLSGAAVGDGYYATGIGDVNGDGFDDAAVPTLDGTAVDVLYGSPTGWVLPAGDTVGGPGMGWGTPWRVGDLDGDGYDELAVGVTWFSGLDRVDVFFGGPGGLSATPDVTVTGPTDFGTAVASGDFDGDGTLELAVSAYGGVTRVYDWTATGPGAFQTLPATGGYGWLSVGDVDGDGSTELVVAEAAGCALWRHDGTRLVKTDTFAVAGSTRIRGAGPGDADGNGLDDVLCGDVSDASLWLSWPDADGDGYDFGGDAPVDCDDTDPAAHPGAPEVVGNGADEDCDGQETCYSDTDLDGFRDRDTWVRYATDGDCVDAGEATDATPRGDCDDGDASVFPGAPELDADGIDSDCDGIERCYADVDRDGARSTTLILGSPGCSGSGQALVGAAIDCDDADAARTPGRFDTPLDGVDGDCTGYDSCWADLDDDGWLSGALIDTLDADCDDPGEGLDTDPSWDCDDSSAAVSPAAPEIPGTGVDEDCDSVEICWVDRDADGFSSTDVVVAPDFDCIDAGENEDRDPKGDCADLDPARNPGVFDVPGDGGDADCDGGEDCYGDLDHDGFRTDDLFTSLDLDCDDPGEAVGTDPSGDCDDAAATAFPGAAEVTADGVDQDCDGGDVCFLDLDRDGAGSAVVRGSVDVDCAGPGEAVSADDCDDTDPRRTPGNEERCDGVDEDCDTTVDEDPVDGDAWWRDGDGDGFGAGPETLACAAPPDHVAVGDEDCDDGADSVFPGADEVPDDGEDQDCDGQDETTPPPSDTAAPTAPTDGAPADDATDKSAGCGCAPALPPRGGTAGVGAAAGLLLWRRRRTRAGGG